MKLLVLSQFWHPENGVPQRRWAWLSELFVQKGGEVIVIAPPPHYRRNVSLKETFKSLRIASVPEVGIAGEKIYRSPFFLEGKSLAARAFSQGIIAGGALLTAAVRWSRLRQVDAVVGTVPALPTAVVSFILARIAGVPYIIDLRDAWPDLMKEYGSWNRALETHPKRRNLIRRKLVQGLSYVVHRGLNALLGRADAVIVTSEDLGKKLAFERGNCGQQLIVTLRNVFPASSKKVAGRTPLTNRPLHVLYAGTLGRAQNLKNVVDAVEIARCEGIPIELAFVGGGAAVSALRGYADMRNVDAKFFHVRSASEVASFYDWADTALVHLTDWEPLDMAVPSKTYELMSAGLHISGAVKGETARIIRELGAGDVVPPEEPEKLAALFADLYAHPDKLLISDKGRLWVRNERENVVPERMDKLMGWIGSVR